jgi:MFS family permease
MTTAYTIGATIGPALGGFLAGKGDFYAGAKLAVIGSLLSAILSLTYLPNKKAETNSSNNGNNNSNNNDTPIKKQRSFVDDLRRSKEIASRPTIWPLLTVKVLGGVCASMHSTALPVVLTQKLHFEPQQLGLSMSIAMFSVAGFGAIAMAPVTKIYGSFGMMNIGLLTRAVFGLIMATVVSFATKSSSGDHTDITVIEVITVSVLYSLAQHILATGLTTQTTGSVDKEEQGSLLGLEHSLFSLARIGGPAIGTALLGFGNGGLWPVEIACGVFDIILAASLSISLPQSEKRKDS